MGKSTLKIDRYWLSPGDAGFLLFFGLFQVILGNPIKGWIPWTSNKCRGKYGIDIPLFKKHVTKRYPDSKSQTTGPQTIFRWWFWFFYLHPYLGRRFPLWLIFFRWVVQPPTSISWAIHLWGLPIVESFKLDLPGLVEKPSLGSLAGKLCQGWKSGKHRDGRVMRCGDTICS